MTCGWNEVLKRTAAGAIDYDAYEYRAREFLVAVCPELVKPAASKVGGYGAEPADPIQEQVERERRTQQDAQLTNFMNDITSRLEEQKRRHRRTRRKE